MEGKKCSSIRRKPFTNLETEVLLACIDKRKHIIECKITNEVSNYQKQKSWMDLTEEFNSTPLVTNSTVTQLQNFYRNLKRKATKEKSEERREIMKTGGGPNPCCGLSSLEQLTEIGAVRLPLPCELDSDVTDLDHETIDIILDAPSLFADENSQPDNPTPSTSREDRPRFQTPSLLSSYRQKTKRRESASVKAAEQVRVESLKRMQADEELLALTKKKMENENKKIEMEMEVLALQKEKLQLEINLLKKAN